MLLAGRALLAHQLVVGESHLVGTGPLLVQLRLGPLTLGHGVRHAGAMLGLFVMPSEMQPAEEMPAPVPATPSVA